MLDPIFQGVIGHEQILRTLSLGLNHPAGAYLFSGPRSVGKKLIAERCAKKLLGLSADALLDAHPDAARLVREEEKKDISVEQVRGLIERLSLTSAHGGYRVALIDDADRLNEQAANALLKSVEEPSAKTVYFFITEQPDRLPATLRSRLTTILFERIPLKDQPEWMRTSSAISSDDTRMQQEILTQLHTSPLGVQCAAIERLHKTMESAPDSDLAWREGLEQLMKRMEPHLQAQPSDALRVGLGLLHAWRLTGTAISPRIALEWAAVKPYIKEDLYLPAFLSSSYLV